MIAGCDGRSIDRILELKGLVEKGDSLQIVFGLKLGTSNLG